MAAATGRLDLGTRRPAFGKLLPDQLRPSKVADLRSLEPWTRAISPSTGGSGQSHRVEPVDLPLEEGAAERSPGHVLTASISCEGPRLVALVGSRLVTTAGRQPAPLQDGSGSGSVRRVRTSRREFASGGSVGAPEREGLLGRSSASCRLPVTRRTVVIAWCSSSARGRCHHCGRPAGSPP
jgi:hypothetical protein